MYWNPTSVISSFKQAFVPPPQSPSKSYKGFSRPSTWTPKLLFKNNNHRNLPCWSSRTNYHDPSQCRRHHRIKSTCSSIRGHMWIQTKENHLDFGAHGLQFNTRCLDIKKNTFSTIDCFCFEKLVPTARTAGRKSKSSQEVVAIKSRDGIGYKLHHHGRWSPPSFIFKHSFNRHVVPIEPFLPVRFCGDAKGTGKPQPLNRPCFPSRRRKTEEPR